MRLEAAASDCRAPATLPSRKRHSPIPAVRKLALDESEHAVVITGCVTSYYLKQLAQETVMPVLNGRTLLNRVAVVCLPVENLVACNPPSARPLGRLRMCKACCCLTALATARA